MAKNFDGGNIGEFDEFPAICQYVTGYWKTDHNVTLGQLHFIGPANSHTHALSMHCCFTGLS